MSAYTALLSAIEHELDEEIARLRLATPAQEYKFRPGAKVHDFHPDGPKEHHESVLDIYDPSSDWRPGTVIGIRWWPCLDGLCALRRRIGQYHREVGE